MSWWILGIALVVVLLFVALKHYRRGVLRQVLELIRTQHPELQIAGERGGELELRFPDGSSGNLALANLYRAVAQGPRDEQSQRETIRSFVTHALEAVREATQPLSLETAGDRLMPFLAESGFAAGLAANGHELAQRATTVPGLLILYVVDSENAVRYVAADQLAALGLDAEALHQRAMANLARRSITELVRGVIDRREVSVVKLGGSLDATRLLLVPEALGEGEELVAVIPDRETLALMPVPQDDRTWELARKMARTPSSPYEILGRPVRVTREGFAPA